MKERLKSNKLLSPVITIVFLIVFVSILSLILHIFNVDGSITSIVNGKLETSIVVINNIFSKEGFIYILSNLTNNFNLLEQLVLIIISLFSISILDSSGILKHISTPLKRVKSKYITFLFVFISVISSIFLDYSYIILIPLVSVIYKYLNKNPILGIITVFVSITLGYCTGLIYNFDDYSLGMLTQAAAVIDVDSSYRYSLYSNLYIMLASTFLISFIITTLIEKYVVNKITVYEANIPEIKTSKKALSLSILFTLIILIIIVILILPNGILLDNTQDTYVAKLFSSNSPFNLSFMYIFLFICAISGLVYGFVSKNFEDNHEYSKGFTTEFNNVGYLLLLLFLYSILMSIIDWTNIGTVFISKFIYLLEVFDFTGVPLIVITFIFIILMSILVPSAMEKWTLISPILIPIFMRANITPEFTQFLFKVSDSVGKCLSPIFVFLIVSIGFITKYEKDKTSLFGTYKIMLPVILTIIVFWIVLLVIWYISGLPLGFGTFATM